jgi:hypothetical protein
MARCIERTFEILPPNLAEISDRSQTLDAAINIQAFVMSAFGYCENIAWIWVDVRLPTGAARPTFRQIPSGQRAGAIARAGRYIVGQRMPEVT